MATKKRRPTFDLGPATAPATSTGWVYRSDADAPVVAATPAATVVDAEPVTPAAPTAPAVPAVRVAPEVRVSRRARVAPATGAAVAPRPGGLLQTLLLPFAAVAIGFERRR